MSSFSVTTNHYLRMIYMGNTDVMKKTDREDKPSSRLTTADSKALKLGIRNLRNFNYDSDTADEEPSKKKYKGTLRAFSDAYNNMLDSGSSSQNKSISKLTKKLKEVSNKYADKLSDLGITFDKSKGYMKVRDSAVTNISLSKFKEYLGSDAEYSKEIDEIAKGLSKHIDLAL